MAITAQDIITQSLALFNITDPGIAPSTAQLNDGLLRFQQMIDSWTAEGIHSFAVTTVGPVTATGVASYTLGSGGTFSATRYADVVAMRLRSGTIDYDIPRGDQADYGRFPLKTIGAFAPSFFYYDHGYPTATVFFAGIPGAGDLYADVATPLTPPAALATDLVLTMPPGYLEAYVYNLGLRLAAPYGQSVPGDVRDLAISALARIQRGHSRLPVLDLASGYLGGGARMADVNWWRTGGLT